MTDIDISVGLVLLDDTDSLQVISTNKADKWTPCTFTDNIPSETFSWGDYPSRMKKWMKHDEDEEYDHELYEITAVPEFSHIVGQSIQDVEILHIDEQSPFGVKLMFEKDYIVSSPIPAGNTIETKQFNQGNKIHHFAKVWKARFASLKYKLENGYIE
ncbi:hypothetical protein COR50_22015 [Chitinophaga caeni]|uniref:Uncharacterized protein n=2 Tax=Chitinophaga caeni TaxID=2029983 RepID=A0A291R0K5_9BACT|nr:hypothetical protein COR50_22015 [Chitinophaga caeni]